MGDKPAQRRHQALLDTSRIPLVRGIHTVNEFNAQRNSVSLRVSRVRRSLKLSFWNWCMRTELWMRINEVTDGMMWASVL